MIISPRGLLRAAVICAIALAQIAATPQQEPYNVNSYVRAQRLVDVGGRRLNIICSGTGSPTVILEAGLNSDATVWRLVQPVIARHTHVCSYDRAGMGFSDPTTSSRDATSVVTDLHALLHGAHISPPYVFVGHSSGGMYTRLYTDRYPKEVVGLVQVDPESEYEYEAYQKIEPMLAQLVRSRNRQLEACAVNVSRGVCAFFPGLAAYRKALRADGCPKIDPADCAVAEITGEHEMRPSYWRDVASEADALAKSSDEVLAQQRSYGDLPLIVLSESLQGDLEENAEGHDPIPPAEQRAAWHVSEQLKERIAALSTVGAHFVVAGSEHGIQLDHPSVVVSAVDEVVDQARYK